MALRGSEPIALRGGGGHLPIVTLGPATKSQWVQKTTTHKKEIEKNKRGYEEGAMGAGREAREEVGIVLGSSSLEET